MCVTMQQHQPPPPPYFSHDKLGKNFVFYSQKYGKSDQLQTTLTISICKTGIRQHGD